MVNVTSSMVIGCGMRAIHCINQGIASSWIKASDVQRMVDLILSTQNGDGNQSIAICQGKGSFFFNYISSFLFLFERFAFYFMFCVV